MRDREREAFRRGYGDYETYVAQKRLHIAQAFNSLYSPIWRPPPGHEDAYIAGWETARSRAPGERKAPVAA